MRSTRPHAAPRSRQAGMTLLEVLIAVVIIGISFVALAFAQVLGFRVTRTSQQTQIARDLATLEMELVRADGFGYYKDCSGSENSKCHASTTPSDHPDYTVTREITNRPPGLVVVDPPALVAVTVTVRWQGNAYVLTNYLSCGDPNEESSTRVPCPAASLWTAGAPGGGGGGSVDD